MAKPNFEYQKRQKELEKKKKKEEKLQRRLEKKSPPAEGTPEDDAGGVRPGRRQGALNAPHATASAARPDEHA